MTKRALISIAAALLVAAAAGVAYATIPDDQGVIHACYKTDGGQLRASGSATCNPSETALSWNQAGPQGAPGPQGPQGPAGPAGSGSDVYSETASGSGGQPVPVGLPGGIAQLPLPAGKYTVIASLIVGNSAFDSNFVQCELFAGSDVDEAFAALGALTDPGDTVKLDLTSSTSSPRQATPRSIAGDMRKRPGSTCTSRPCARPASRRFRSLRHRVETGVGTKDSEDTMRNLVLIGIGAMVVAVATGVAWATIPDGQGIIHGCYKTDNGQLRVVDAASCNASETPLSWRQTGPQGVPGAQGPPGPKGDPGAPGAAGPSGLASVIRVQQT
jgi:hypothetical protein